MFSEFLPPTEFTRDAYSCRFCSNSSIGKLQPELHIYIRLCNVTAAPDLIREAIAANLNQEFIEREQFSYGVLPMATSASWLSSEEAEDSGSMIITGMWVQLGDN